MRARRAPLQITHDVTLFRFDLPSPSMALGLPVGKHVKIYAPNRTGVEAGNWCAPPDPSHPVPSLAARGRSRLSCPRARRNGREDPEAEVGEIQRSYTPTSSEEDLGHLDLVIKVYKGGVIDRFPDGGKMSQYFDGLKVGDEVSLSGPVGMTEYVGAGKWLHGRREIKATHVGMMAGGTGITPMYQILQVALRDAKDKTKFSLIFANQTADDILLKDEIDALAAKYPSRFSVHYTLDRPPKKWSGSTGFITPEMIQENLPAPKASTLVVMCGPPPMVKFACKQNLDKLGYDKKLQLAF